MRVKSGEEENGCGGEGGGGGGGLCGRRTGALGRMIQSGRERGGLAGTKRGQKC